MKQKRFTAVLIVLLMVAASSVFASILKKQLASYNIVSLKETTVSNPNFHEMSRISTKSKVYFWNTTDGGLAYQFVGNNGAPAEILTLYDQKLNKAGGYWAYSRAQWRTSRGISSSGSAVLYFKPNGTSTLYYNHRENGKSYTVQLLFKP